MFQTSTRNDSYAVFDVHLYQRGLSKNNLSVLLVASWRKSAVKMIIFEERRGRIRNNRQEWSRGTRWTSWILRAKMTLLSVKTFDAVMMFDAFGDVCLFVLRVQL
jgi:hypothetical protein